MIVLISAPTLQARSPRYGTATLDVCNKGTVAVEVVVAKKEDFSFVDSLDVYGWTHIPPGACKQVYEAVGGEKGAGLPAYIGFAIYERGQISAGTIDPVPDLGLMKWTWISDVHVLTKADKKFCVSMAGASYQIRRDAEPDCSTFHPNHHDHGPYSPLAAAVYFQPQLSFFWDVTDKFEGGKYYLNVAPKPGDRNLHASKGTESGADAKDDDVDVAKALKKLGDAAEEIRRRQAAQERAAAEAERQRSAQAEADRQKRLEIAAANGDPNAKLSLEVAARLEAESRQKWSGPRFSPGGYVPRWMDENIVLRGTVARVYLKTPGSPPWLTIFFRESPDSTFVVCSPHPDLFQEKFGSDFSGLIGKTIEVMGQVEAPFCAGKTASIRVVEANQFRLTGPEQPNANAAGNQPVFSARIRPAELTSDDYERANRLPVMIGKVSVKQFCGLVLGDGSYRVARIYGQPAADRGTEQVYGPNGGLIIAYTRRNIGVSVVRRVTANISELSWLRSHLANFGAPPDRLVALIGQDESAAIALLGPPQKRESQDAQTYNLYWTFETAGYSAGDANTNSNQTVALGFKAGLGCSSVSVTW